MLNVLKQEMCSPLLEKTMPLAEDNQLTTENIMHVLVVLPACCRLLPSVSPRPLSLEFSVPATHAHKRGNIGNEKTR